MPRKRIIDPCIWSDEKFNQLSIKARLFFIGLFSSADDEGFIQADPNFLKSLVFPYENWTADEINSLCEELKKLEMIKIYGGKVGEKNHYYIYLPRWWDYQPKPDYPTPSKIANLLVYIGELDSKEALTIHRKFCRKNAGRKARRSRKSSDGVGVGVGVGLGVGVGEGVGVKEIIELFNSTCSPTWLEVKKENLAEEELKKIRLRLKKYPKLEWWGGVFEKMTKTSFLRGENKRGWKPSFVWLFKNNTNALKVYRGDYDKEKFAGEKAWLAEQEAQGAG